MIIGFQCRVYPYYTILPWISFSYINISLFVYLCLSVCLYVLSLALSLSLSLSLSLVNTLFCLLDVFLYLSVSLCLSFEDFLRTITPASKHKTCFIHDIHYTKAPAAVIASQAWLHKYYQIYDLCGHRSLCTDPI